MDRARTYGKEDSLLAAIGLASGQETMGQAKDSVSGAIDSIRTRVSDFSEQRKQGREESRIKSALGRPVTRVILDSNDNVILETAQIVTNQAIEQART
ncbi:MAG: hypothetical protein WKH64_13260, partial [Chloroflexia bacterium]